MSINNFEELEDKLYSAVVADILDEVSEETVKNSAMNQKIRPITRNMSVIGRAFTILASEIFEQPKSPYKKELEAISQVSTGEVVVVRYNGELKCGFWGEILTTAVKENGCRGAIIDGFSRDTEKILNMEFPTFVKGFSPYDSKGRSIVVDYQIPVRSGDTLIKPGDLIVGDYDGIVCVPREIEDKVIDKAFKKIEGENVVKKELLNGMGIKEAYEKYRIL